MNQNQENQENQRMRQMQYCGGYESESDYEPDCVSDSEEEQDYSEEINEFAKSYYNEHIHECLYENTTLCEDLMKVILGYGTNNMDEINNSLRGDTYEQDRGKNHCVGIHMSKIEAELNRLF